MKKYILKRLLSVLPILFIVSVVVFTLVHLAPGGPAAAMLGSDATMEDIAALEEQMGLNDPLYVQYFRWMGNVFHGDLGTSTTGDTVTNMIRDHFLPTINLALYAMVISLLIALPLGMLAARKRGTLVDSAVSVLALAGVSVPSFLLGLGLMMLFAVNLRWFPVSGYAPWSDGVLAHIHSIPQLDGDRTKPLYSVEGMVPLLSQVPQGCCRFAERCPKATAHCREAMPELQEVTPGHWVRCWMGTGEE